MRSVFTFVFILLTILGSHAQKYFVPLSDEAPQLKSVVSDTKVHFKFSYNGININTIDTDEGVFTELDVPNTYKSGSVGDPELVSTNKIFTIPENSTVNVKVKAYTTEIISIGKFAPNYKIKPLQPAQSKSNDVKQKFAYNANSYKINRYESKPIATIKVLGKMRNKQIVKLVVNPVQYNPAKNSIKFYNDIELEVNLVKPKQKSTTNKSKTNSPYFSEHITKVKPLIPETKYASNPDLVTYPVKYLIVTPNSFVSELQEFILWKTQKGFEVVVGNMDEIGSNAAEIKTWVHAQYNNATVDNPAPSFLLLVGDIAQVPVSQERGVKTYMETDLYYASVDGDMFPEMYYGRIPAQNEQQLSDILNKTLYYERYEFADDAFLNDVTLIAGADATWNYRVGRPTVNYGTNFYFNAENGFSNVNAYLSSYEGCYLPDKIGVSLINYTAHCSQTSWDSPYLSAGTIASYNNEGKYGIAIGNCCTSGDFSINECIGEAFVRNPNGGAVAYIGSVPDTYWWEDFYWAVGAHAPVGGQYPDTSASSMGVYDAAFVPNYHTVDAMIFVGNLSVTEAHNEGYTSDVSSLYYWEAYHCLGDPSISPYLRQGAENTVKHDTAFNFGIEFFEVKAAPGSLVALSNKNGLIGTALAGADSLAQVSTDTITLIDTVTLVVTKANYKPYIQKLPIGLMHGTYLYASSIQLIDTLGNNNGQLDYAEEAQYNLVVKNIGNQQAEYVQVSVTTSNTNVALFNNENVEVSNIAANNAILVENAFSLMANDSVPNQEKVTLNVTLSDSVPGKQRSYYSYSHYVHLHAPDLSIVNYLFIDDFNGNGNNTCDFGETVALNLAITNTGTSNANVACSLVNISVDPIIQVNTSNKLVGALPVNDTVFASFEIYIPETYVAKPNDTLLFIVSDKGYESRTEIVVPIGQDLFAEIGTENNSAVKYPFYNYYKSNISQILFLNSEFGYGVKSIKSVAFNIKQFTANLAYCDLSNFKINIGNTSKNELNVPVKLYNKISAFSKGVYNLPDSSGWLKFDLDTAFVIDESQNLLFEVMWGLNDNYAPETTSTTVLASNTAFKSVYWGASDNLFPAPYQGSSTIRPNMQFEFDSVGIINFEVSGDLAINNKHKIENCSIVINNNTELTNEFGRTKHHFIEYTGNYVINFNVYGYYDTTLNYAKNATYEHIYMELKRRPELTVEFVNKYNVPIANVEAEINNLKFISDNNGQVISYNNGINKYTTLKVNMNAYHMYYDSVFIDSTINKLKVYLDDKYSKLSLKVINTLGQPISSVTTIIGGEAILTDSSGLATFQNLLQGNHVVQFYHSNYTYVIDTILVKNSTDTLPYTLNGIGDLQVNIYSDSVKQGNINFTINDSLYTTNVAGELWLGNLPEGKYKIVVNNPEFYYYTDTVELFHGNVTVNVNLVPKADLVFYINNSYAGLANVNLTCNDSIYLSDSLGMITIHNVDSGYYNYSINCDGYYVINQSVLVKQSDTVINLLLNQIPDVYIKASGIVNDTGVVQIQFDSLLFELDQNGEIHIENIQAGNYTVKVELQGYYLYVDTINVGNESVFYEIQLKPIPDIEFFVEDSYLPIGEATVVLDSLTLKTNDFGKALFANIKQGTYSYNISKEGYELLSDKIQINANDTIVNCKLIPYTDVKLIIIGMEEVLQNASVEFDTLSFVSDINGEVNIKHLATGKYYYKVTHKGYDAYYDSISVNSTNIIEYINLQPTTYTLTFTVTGAGKIIRGAEVVLGNESNLTDSLGKASFSNLYGEKYYTFQVSKHNFISIADSVFVLDRDVSKSIDLEQIVYDVVFVVSDTNGFVEGANISFDSKVKQTNEYGEASFIDVVPYNELTYYIRKVESHIADTGMINLVCDTVMYINLSEIPVVSNLNTKIDHIAIYPNPANSYIIIEAPNSSASNAYIIYSTLGNVMLKGKLNHNKTIIPVNSLSKGIYLINIIVNDNVILRPIVVN